MKLSPTRRAPLAAALVLAVLLGAAFSGSTPAPVLRLATTTSTQDSGLLRAILPSFEQVCGCRVDVIAVGTGQALAIGRRGDADVLLVHARQAEDAFIAEGHAVRRHDVMYNDFVVVGPTRDPAKIDGRPRAADAFRAIAEARAAFNSRGDKSGTDMAEKAIWQSLGIAPAASWYRSLGQGMGETLVVANEQLAYTLADRGTWLAMRQRLPNLRLLVGGRTIAENRDPTLRNQYGAIAINPAKHPGVQVVLAARFIEWLLSAETQRAIGRFGVEAHGQPLFHPVAR